MPVLGLDIGGANLKAADSTGRAHSEVFEIWRAPQELAMRLAKLISQFPTPDTLAVTMTAELADCFATKAEGVEFILRQVREVAGRTPVHVWTASGRFLAPAEGCQQPLTVAAANWHALATWAGRLASEGNALLIDIGSTTTDIIPLRNGTPCPAGLTDVERLLAGELVYTGVRRTPVCAVASAIPLRGQLCSIAAELFATTLDVYLLTGEAAEDPADCATADGRPATKAAARDRLAHMFCCDRTEITDDEIDAIAAFMAGAQQQTILTAIDRVLAKKNVAELDHVIISGSGSKLARRIIHDCASTRQARLVALEDLLAPEIAESACAYAIAVLASEIGGRI